MFVDFYYNIADYFHSSDWQDVVFWAKIISFAVSTLLIVVMIILLSRSKATWWVSESIDSFRKVSLPEKMEKDWQKILDRLEKGDDANLKLAVIEADNLLDSILVRMGLEGKDMGERLEKLNKQQLNSIDDVWDAHRLRNLIVHEPNAIATKHQVERAIKCYEEALKELEVI